MGRIISNRKGTGKKRFSIIGDGETEVWYFQLMKQNENLPIDIKPELPQKKKIEDQYTLVCENLKMGYDKVFWILDFDTIVKEEKERKKGSKSVIGSCKEYVEEFENHENVEIIINSPCFEYWYLLHFVQTSKYFSNYNDLETTLKKHIKGYEKSEKFYKKSSNDLYKLLKPHQKNAISNSRKLPKLNFDNYNTAHAEVYKILENCSIK